VKGGAIIIIPGEMRSEEREEVTSSHTFTSSTEGDAINE